MLSDRAGTHILYKVALKISTHKYFNAFITLCIIGNTAILAMDSVNLTDDSIHVLDKINLSFFSIFCAEMIIKVMGLGFN